MLSRLNLLEQSSFLSKLLHLGDCVTVVLFLWLLTKAWGVMWSDYYSLLAAASLVLSLISFYSHHLYSSWRGRKLYRELIIISKAWWTVAGILLFLLFVTKTSYHYSRQVILSWFILSPAVIFIAHLLMRSLLKCIRTRGFNLKNAVIVGVGDLGARLARHIENMPWAGIKVQGFFDDNREFPALSIHGWPVLGNIDQLSDYLQKNTVHYVYIALPMRDESRIHSIANTTRTLGSALYFVPDLFSLGLLNTEMEFLGDMLLYNFNPNFRRKRYFDIVFSCLALLASLPVMLVIALLIKLEDGGPVFYRHRRITSTGKEFDCLKFRTMCFGADQKLHEIFDSDPAARKEWEGTFKLKNDPRVTNIGRFLRKTSLDELPQFINVLKGEMSVVGARPVVHKELCDYYKGNAGLYCSMKPGLTGPWQVGKRSDTEDYDERVQLDTWYVLNHSLWLDMKIILKTAFRVIGGKGAY